MDVTAKRRLPMMLAALSASAALAGGCSASGSAHLAATEPATATASFSAMGLSFRYPVAWRSRTWSDDFSSFTASLVDLSTSQQRDPCTVKVSPGKKSVICGSPVSKLPAGGVLVRWSADGFPPPWHMPKPNTTIGGRPAVETTTSSGWCATLGGTETIMVMVPRDVTDNWYQMDACLRGPGLAQEEAQISSMLNTVRIAKDDLRLWRHPMHHLSYAA
jgi:hypothetical protein